MFIIRPGVLAPEVREFTAPLSLDQLKDGIGGGYLEVVPGFGAVLCGDRRFQCVAFADEHGKIEGYGGRTGVLEINKLATAKWDWALRQSGHPGLITPDGHVADHLVGQVAIVIGDDEFMESL